MGFGVAGVLGAKAGRSTMSRIFIGLLPLLGIMLWPFAAHAQADGYPSRNVRLVVPYAAGGIADLLARRWRNISGLSWGNRSSWKIRLARAVILVPTRP